VPVGKIQAARRSGPNVIYWATMRADLFRGHVRYVFYGRATIPNPNGGRVAIVLTESVTVLIDKTVTLNFTRIFSPTSDVCQPQNAVDGLQPRAVCHSPGRWRSTVRAAGPEFFHGFSRFWAGRKRLGKNTKGRMRLQPRSAWYAVCVECRSV
jgi:hypothetical protein